MDNLRKAIEVFYGIICPDKLMYDYCNQKAVGGISERVFIENAYDIFEQYGFDEIKNIYSKLNEDWFHDFFNGKSKKSCFYLLTHFNKHILLEDNLEPVVCYEHLLKWRETSFPLGEDIFTCSYLAYMDQRSKRNRHFFAWRHVLLSNNNRLKGLLSQGVAENHFHLKGSGPIFDLSWMALMNSITDHQKAFESLKGDLKLLGQTSNSFSSSKIELDVLLSKAAYIRWYLFEYLKGNIKSPIEKKYLQYESNKNDSFELIMNLSHLQKDINISRSTYGYLFSHRGKKEIADYAIPKNIAEKNFDAAFILYGERKFLYDCFTRIFSNDQNFSRLSPVFHAYLLIKYRLRAELIQINKKVGFGNFLKYQDRKEYFIKEGSIYETAFISMAINDVFKFNSMTSFETRIAPKTSASSIHKNLVKYQKQSSIDSISRFHANHPIDVILDNSNPQVEQHFYTIHFIKKRDIVPKNKIVGAMTCRHNSLRQEIKSQAMAIVNLRESSSPKAKLIKGIDAASSEFAAGPEVFAQVFRYLKDHKLSGKYNFLQDDFSENKLRATFHVGEDFYDLVDGLRAIDEAVHFLNLKQGDRLGHALALGIDGLEFYNFKGRKLMMPKEVILDNVAWLLAKIRKFGIATCRNEVSRLEKLFESLFGEIYANSIDRGPQNGMYTYTCYFDAWKLRGDDPLLYLNNYNQEIEEITNLTYWERCRVNYYYPVNTNIRKSATSKFLYHEYHFNPYVKEKGRKIKQFDITDDYIHLVREVQKQYLHFIKVRNIGIECNPSSNYIIGTFKRYSKHPIIQFYNYPLESDFDRLKDCPQLFVSINTDDQGIFSTSLENEYALLAIALEKEKSIDGKFKYNPTMIYKWLDEIRKMGIEQSFQNA